MKKVLSFMGALALLLFVFLLFGPGHKWLPKSVSAQNQTSQNVVRPIPTAEAIAYLPNRSFRFPGKVKAANRAELSFQVAGQIEQLNILEGQQVKKGEVLASLNRKSLLYQVKAAKAKFQVSKQDFERAAKLYQEKVISKAQYEAAQSVHDVASAELDIKEKDLADTLLVAPFNGLVARRYVEKEEHVDEGEPVLLLQGSSGIEVEVHLPEQLVARGGTDIIDQLQVRFDANSAQPFEAEAMELCMESSRDTQTYALILKLPSPAQMHILPGMTATVTGVIKESLEQTPENIIVLVPVEAVAFTPNAQPYVWIIHPQTHKTEKRMVRIGAMHGNSIEVTQGVSAEEQVVTAGLNSLNEKQRVRPMKKDKEGLEG